MVSDNFDLPVDSAFAKAHREWALSQAGREVEEDFPTLRAIPANISLYLLELVSGWSLGEKLELFSGFVKTARFVRGQPPVALSPPEERALAQFSWPPKKWLPVLSQYAQREERGEFRIDKRLLKTSVRRRLKEVLRCAPKSLGGEERFVSHSANMTIYTELDFGGRTSQMRFTQSLVRGLVDENVPVLDPRMIVHNATIFGWFRLDTQFSYLTNDGIPDAAELVARLCLEFVQAVPGIVDAARGA